MTFAYETSHGIDICIYIIKVHKYLYLHKGNPAHVLFDVETI